MYLHIVTCGINLHAVISIGDVMEESEASDFLSGNIN